MTKTTEQEADYSSEGKKESPREYADRIGVPLIPKRSRRVFRAEANPVMAVCEECGYGIHREDHRTCSIKDCPTYERQQAATPAVVSPQASA
jgi:ribosomal protein L32